MVQLPKYEFMESLHTGVDTCPIKILDGKFKDIVFRYGKISLKEEDDNNLQVIMDINMVVSPENFDQTEQEFTQTVGEIFVDIIEKNAVEAKEPVDLEDDVHQD